MANFYRDNDDIQFLFRHTNVGCVAGIIEEGFKFAKEFDYAPADAAEAIENYDLVLDSLGRLSGDFIAPRSEDIDRQGSRLNEDGTVSYDGKVYDTPGAAAKAALRRPANGWSFWRYKDDKGNWVPLRRLKR